MSAVPDVLEHGAGDTHPEEVLDGRHPEDVVDAEHRLLAGIPGCPREQAVERDGALEVLAEGLLEHDAAAGG